MVKKQFKELSKQSKSRYGNVLERLHKSGVRISDVSAMPDAMLRKAIGFKGKKKSLDGFRRNVSAIKRDTTKRTSLPTYVIPKYKKFGYRKKRLAQVYAELNKTIGETFSGIAEGLRAVNKSYTIKKSYARTRFLLKLPRSQYGRLPQKERDVLALFGY